MTYQSSIDVDAGIHVDTIELDANFFVEVGFVQGEGLAVPGFPTVELAAFVLGW